MVRKFFFLVLFGLGSMLYAQKLQKTALSIKELKRYGHTGRIEGFGSDEKNYYFFFGCKEFYKKNKDAYFIVDKKFTTVKRCYVAKNQDDRFLKIVLNGNDVIVLVVRDKKKEHQIVKQAYQKTTGKLLSETVIASFPMSKSGNLIFRTTMSPDKTKIGLLFMTANKKNSVDTYYVLVLNEACKIEWRSVNDLELSNESFSLKNLTLTDKGELYIAFFSHPENIKKSINKKSYIDLLYLTEETKDKLKIPLEKHETADLSLKPLKNGNIYLAAVLTPDKDSYANEFFSLILNGNNLNDGGSQTKEIVEKNTHTKLPARYFIGGDLLYYLQIEDILELENGNIAVLCEQRVFVSNRGYDGSVFYHTVKGAVSTFFVNGKDASIEDVSVMERFRIGGYPCRGDKEEPLFPLVYGNTVAYLFRDKFENHVAPNVKFKKNDNAESTVLNTQESGKKAKINVLTGKQYPAERSFRDILFQEEDRLIVITCDNKAGYIETLSLP